MHTRRSIVVAGFQAQWILTLLVWIAALLFLFTALLLGPLAWQVGHAQASETDYVAASALLSLHDRIWLPLIALFLALSLVVTRLTHKVAGPLYRFRYVLAEMARGNLSVHAGIRKADYLQLESEALQHALREMAARIARAQAALHELNHCLAGQGTAEDLAAVDLLRAQVAAAEAQTALADFVVARVNAKQTIDAPDGRAVTDVVLN